ncbi:hypothetical protein HDV02_004300 [Globomyces sp. JEL0801]|nr:hypothetical protein HDV02_004300 [Globomyces sp. JEL0801]
MIIIQQNPNKLSGTFVENKHRLKSIVKKPPWRGPLEKPLDRSQSSSILETSSKAFIHSDKPK